MDIQDFNRATNPAWTLKAQNVEDQKCYIDFSQVRGEDIISTLKESITFWNPDQPTCNLFTGHIGCGKSTELLRLQVELEAADFHVIYFESSEDLEITDVDIADVFLAIASRISKSLEKIVLEEPRKFQELLQGAWNILNSEVTGFKGKFAGQDIGYTADGEKLSLSLGIGEITTKMKSDSTLRTKINQYLGPQKTELLQVINQELLEPAISKLKQQGKNGLVVIVDNLDRIDNSIKPWGRTQQEYLFVDQGEYLTKLNCHVIYTMPLALRFSNEYGTLTQRFPEEPKILPMVPVKYSDGSIHQQGLALMRQMILARAFPNLTPEDRLNKITDIFDIPESLDRLCQVSGGHVRDILKLLNTWIMKTKDKKFPLQGNTLEQIIRERRNEMSLAISAEEWQLLRHVKETKEVSDDLGYQKLIRSRFVFEYRDQGELWFDVNPILAESKKLSESGYPPI
ncbi:AAA family ATPase [Cuspidothrix issatschenkoi]|uniref:KAP family P-loop domain-containing protein n=1 Tax=Cuspidothrix issatschenkoi CHARLIE-1 TaxID=2052836 RepID=A0A2S6CP51_9CYAN|nr:AAA family ATPase [Cuspidothrix issatschenkoi]PPJ61535.1 KAP family P-loop domain-containing protein [Cuspidothrix issatschenkoi CHARLIE-1]